METLHRFSLRHFPIPLTEKCFLSTLYSPIFRHSRMYISRPAFSLDSPPASISIYPTRKSNNSSPASIAKAGWFLGLGEKKGTNLSKIVKAGDPVLHEPAREVDVGEIGSEWIQKIIDDMVWAMRNAPGVGLAAPQIGVPLRIIVVEDTREYISYAAKEETKAQDRRPFDLLVILNPKLKKKSDKTGTVFQRVS